MKSEEQFSRANATMILLLWLVFCVGVCRALNATNATTTTTSVAASSPPPTSALPTTPLSSTTAPPAEASSDRPMVPEDLTATWVIIGKQCVHVPACAAATLPAAARSESVGVTRRRRSCRPSGALLHMPIAHSYRLRAGLSFAVLLALVLCIVWTHTPTGHAGELLAPLRCLLCVPENRSFFFFFFTWTVEQDDTVRRSRAYSDNFASFRQVGRGGKQVV